jgi:peptidoglycan/LPS O-acetylase OafA/YrhL
MASAVGMRIRPDASRRLDIDGLRAIAVLGVVIYHADARRAPGGFIGVDVFFVISGYLITGLLLKALQEGQFSFADFYARRIRRLFPALGLVICSALALGWILLPTDSYAQLGKQILAGCLFVSNLALWHEAGYFDADARLKPLLHLWSLGVEEQFYIVWPILLLWTTRRKLPVVGLVAILLLASFTVNVIEVRTNAVATFYSDVCWRPWNSGPANWPFEFRSLL